MPTVATAVSVADRAKTIRAVADTVIGYKAQKAKINEAVREERAKLKAMGIGAGDFGTILRLYELEPEDRDAAIRSLTEVAEALEVAVQGELFADVA